MLLVGSLSTLAPPFQALALLNSIAQADVRCYTAAGAACGAARRWKEALSLLSKMEERGIKPDAKALQTFAWAIGQVGLCRQGRREGEGRGRCRGGGEEMGEGVEEDAPCLVRGVKTGAFAL